MPSLSLEGKVAIITGGGTGLGRSIALQFAEAGADVVVASRRLSVLEKVAREVAALGRRSLAVQTDISRKTDVDNLVKRVVNEFGVIDILVNNAAVLLRRPLFEATEDDWDKIMNTDLKGYWLCSQAVGKKMVERKKGNIINVASTSSFMAAMNRANYSIAKVGVVMLTRILARELASYNIRVNAFAPGLMPTEMSQVVRSDPVTLKNMVSQIPLGRMSELSECAAVALFLASDASSYITGETIIVDGGRLA